MSVEERDIDDLLDELQETGLPRQVSHPAQRMTQSAVVAPQSKPTIRKEMDDVDDLLREINDDIPSLPNVRTTSQGKPEPLQPQARVTGKCAEVIIGEPRVPRGCAKLGQVIACDALRCLKCDFKVLVFPNAAWDVSCDYLFFRNNMPNVDKLQQKILAKQGSAAYACQCSWRSVTSSENITYSNTLRWVCGTHK
eukprot:TRINITY_DN1637_c0_g1_i2.p1 TRINITY_DN1637_c0_g1~~TRINITY_DN1637_c0_g1_i2.p1  ORF type:complete len:195 (-),score=31.26 TRINITY_DN1637_c0_g1_i2:441-1025(-)